MKRFTRMHLLTIGKAIGAFMATGTVLTLGILLAGAVGRDVTELVGSTSSADAVGLRGDLERISRVVEWREVAGSGSIEYRVLISPSNERLLRGAPRRHGFVLRVTESGYDFSSILPGNPGAAWLVLIGHLSAASALFVVRQYTSAGRVSAKQSACAVIVGAGVWATGWLAEYLQGILGVLPVEFPFSAPWAPVTLALVVLVAPIVEEWLFRGLLLHQLLLRSVPFASWLVAASFAACHGSLRVVLPTFLMGLLLGIWYERVRSWTACAIAHAVANSIALLQLRLG